MAEIDARAAAQQGGRIRDITAYQWLVLFIAWAGWSLDITDFTLYGLVLRQSLTELLGGSPTIQQIGAVGGLITTVGLLGWAVGGFVFGIIADYLGRVRTLALSILIYSVFTALQGVAQEPWQLGLFRFIAGLGTGAELMIAIPLVAEAFAETHRAKILGFMMTGGGFGNLFAAYIYDLVGPYGWRYVFFFGIVPALLLAFIRRGMVEPERFAAVKARRQALKTQREHSEEDREFLRLVPVQLFSRKIRFQTLVGVLYALGTLLAVWTSQAWLPTIQNLLLEKQGITGNAAIPYVSFGMKLWGIGGIIGYIAFGFIADVIGRRPTIFLYSVGTLGLGLYLFLGVHSYDPYPVLLLIYGFFVIGIFFGARNLHLRAVSDACTLDRGRFLQWLWTDLYQLRAAGGRVAGPAARRADQRDGDHDLLCRAQRNCRDPRPRDTRRAIAKLTGTRTRQGWRRLSCR